MQHDASTTKRFQVTPEGETLILKKNQQIFFTRKLQTTVAKDFYWPPSSTRAQTMPLFPPPEKRKPEGKAAVHPEGTAIKKQENTTTNQLVTRKIHTNRLHTKLSNTIEDRIHVTANQLHYILKRMIYIFEHCAKSKRNYKSLHKVAEEHDLKPGEIICPDLISQKKPSYGGSKNRILIQDSDINQNCLYSQIQKKI